MGSDRIIILKRSSCDDENFILKTSDDDSGCEFYIPKSAAAIKHSVSAVLKTASSTSGSRSLQLVCGTYSEALERLSTGWESPKTAADRLTLRRCDGSEFTISRSALYTSAAGLHISIVAAVETLSRKYCNPPITETTIDRDVDDKTLDMVVAYFDGRPAPGNDEEAMKKRFPCLYGRGLFENDEDVMKMKGLHEEVVEMLSKKNFKEEEEVVWAAKNKSNYSKGKMDSKVLWAKKALDSFVRLFCINSLILN